MGIENGGNVAGLVLGVVIFIAALVVLNWGR